MIRTTSRFAILVPALVALMGSTPRPVQAQSDELPVYLRDRGTGQRTSMFATYIRRGELLVYPFFEHYRDRNFEYKPSELGHGLDQDFRGKYRAEEGILYVAYGFTDWVAVEVEAAVISATLHKAPDDFSSTPGRIQESGVGDVEGQLRMRWLKESGGRPEVFSFVEAVTPSLHDKLLIGTPDWEFKWGGGLTKGASWGTLTLRAAMGYAKSESKLELGEYAIEYVKRLTPAWLAYAGLEGTQDELELITEAQVRLTNTMRLKINNGFGLTAKATDWAPEVGVMFSVPTGSR